MQYRRKKCDEYEAAAEVRSLTYAEANAALDAAALATAHGEAPCSKAGKTNLDDDDPFADIDMLDELDDRCDEHQHMQALAKRYAEEKAKLQHVAAKRARSHANMDLAKEGVGAEASALAGRAATSAAAAEGGGKS